MYHLSVIIEIYDLRLQITILKEELKLSSNYMRIEENFITVYGQMMGRLIGSFCEFRMYCILVHIDLKNDNCVVLQMYLQQIIKYKFIIYKTP